MHSEFRITFLFNVKMVADKGKWNGNTEISKQFYFIQTLMTIS